MHKNKVWLSFLILVIFATFANVGLATYRFLNYQHLKAQAPLQNFTTEIEEISETYFYVKVNYVFLVNGKAYDGQSYTNDRHLLNRWAAEEEDKMVSIHPPRVWYDPQNPDYSSLIKKFPLRDVGTALALVGLLVYFFWLGYYVGNQNMTNKAEKKI